MPTQTNGQRITVGRSKYENSARKFRDQTKRSFAALQARRRERIPLELVAVLRALTGDECGPIVFAAKEEV